MKLRITQVPAVSINSSPLCSNILLRIFSETHWVQSFMEDEIIKVFYPRIGYENTKRELRKCAVLNEQ